MNVKRFLLAAGVALLGAGWAQASAVLNPPGHYTITLADWDPNQQFTFTPNPTGIDTSDFHNNFCPSGDYWACICDDPSIRINAGGGSTDESGVFTFSADGNGNLNGEASNFANTGPPINSVLVTTTLGSDQSNSLFTCSSNIFQHCGFFNDDLEVLFWNNPGVTVGHNIATAVPEPAQWIILLLALTGMIVARSRKTSASSSFAQTQR